MAQPIHFLPPLCAGSAASLITGIQPSGAELPIFWIAPGSRDRDAIGSYFRLAELLGRDQPSFGIHWPNEPLATLEALATACVKAARALQPRGPYFIGGFSLGGNIAFEMARQLETQEQTVSLLVLIESAAKPYDLGETNWKHALFGLFRREVRPPFDKPSQPLNLPPPSHSGRVVLFRAGKTTRQREDPTIGWGRIATSGVAVNVIPGPREKMLAEPNVRLLADELRACLAEARAKNSELDLAPARTPRSYASRSGPNAG